jgi:FkbM family methyltransferase
MFQNKTLMAEIAANHASHSCETEWYKSFSLQVEQEVRNGHTPSTNAPIQLGEIGQLNFPFYSMGQVTSSNLFGLDELILFSYYFQNTKRYERVLDLGANIGLHTVVLLLLGYEVTSYEPDPIHVSQINKVLSANNFSNVGIVEAAVSNANGTSDFIRVLGNTTGSHLLGAKNSLPYGGHDMFSVKTLDLNEVLEGSFGLVKMDVEGHESTLISHLTPKNLKSADFILEVGSRDNAQNIYSKVNELGLNMFSQKRNWQKVMNISDVPTSYKEGSLLISSTNTMTWTS